MAILINGNGNKAIWAAQDADLIAAICGNVTSIAAVGNQFAATQEDASTIGLADGVIITKEGRRIQLDTGDVDLFAIPTGTAGVTSYYIIGYKLSQQSDTSQICETFVQKMNSSSETIPEDTFKGGATEVYVSCYRVTQDGLNIDTIEGLLPLMNNLINGNGGGGMPTLDFTNYIHVFASSAPSDIPSGATYGTSYTATEDCYLGGSVFGNNADVYVKINGHKVYGVRNTSSGTRLLPIPFTKLSSGDTVTSVNASNVANAQDQLYIYVEK